MAATETLNADKEKTRIKSRCSNKSTKRTATGLENTSRKSLKDWDLESVKSINGTGIKERKTASKCLNQYLRKPTHLNNELPKQPLMY